MKKLNEPGKIILINGASSSGKSTLAFAVREQFELPLLRFSYDLFLDGDILPLAQIKNGRFSWQSLRPAISDGFYGCLPVLAQAGNNLILDHIVESKAEMANLVRLLKGIDVFFVGLHCSLEELERREIARGNRRLGDARADFALVHSFTTYDLELNSEEATVAENVERLIAAWQARQTPTAFDKMAAEIGGE